MTSSFWLETKNKGNHTTPDCAIYNDRVIKGQGRDTCALGLTKEHLHVRKREDVRKGYPIRMNFENSSMIIWRSLHFSSLCSFSIYSSNARTPASHAHEFLMSPPSASASELQKRLAGQGLTISGRLWKRSVGWQDSCVDKGPLAGLVTRNCGKPRNNTAQMGTAAKVSVPSAGLSLWELRKAIGIPLSFLPNPTVGKECISFPPKPHS